MQNLQKSTTNWPFSTSFDLLVVSLRNFTSRINKNHHVSSNQAVDRFSETPEFQFWVKIMKKSLQRAKIDPFSFQTQKCTSPERHFQVKLDNSFGRLFLTLLKPVSVLVSFYPKFGPPEALLLVSASQICLNFIIFIRFLRFFSWKWCLGLVDLVKIPGPFSQTPSKTYFRPFWTHFGPGAF